MSVAVHTAFQLGLLYGIATLSTVVSFRFLRFPDLTVDGSFVLGAAVAGVLIHDGISATLAISAAAAAGFLAGVCTGLWHRVFGINKFFAGILTMMMLYSINLRILGGANISLLGSTSIFRMGETTPEWMRTLLAGACFLAAAAVVCLLFWNRIGLLMRAVGSNASGLSMPEFRLTLLSLVGMGFANSLAALSGALVAQYQRFADVGMGLGVTVNVFAALFLGEGLLLVVLGMASYAAGRTRASSHSALAGAGVVAGEVAAACIGMIGFMSIVIATLYLGLRPSDTKICAALLLFLGLIWRRTTRSSFLVPAGEYER